jgi:hypothetical protein
VYICVKTIGMLVAYFDLYTDDNTDNTKLDISLLLAS